MDWEKAAEEEKKYEDAEEQRLMYVASTRARNLLVVSTYEGDLGDKRSWRTLDDALGDLPELERTSDWIKLVEEESFRFPAVPREKVVVTKAELERARKDMAANTESAGVPTYLVETVTAVAKKERELPARRHDTGLGLSWGRLVHQALEAIGSGRMKPATTDEKQAGPGETRVVCREHAGGG